MQVHENIGKVFKEAREKRSQSIDEVSKLTRIHPNVIKDIENGVFDRLAKTYMKGFVKKYSDLLGLNTEDLIKEYEAILPSAPSPDVFSSQRLVAAKGKRVQTVFIVILSLAFAALTLVLINITKGKIASLSTARSTARDMTREPAKKDEDISPKPAVARQETQETGPIVLTIKAKGESWVRITDGQKMVFDGVLKEGDSKTWKSDGTFSVWTGKAEMLDFIVNTRKIGKVSEGVVKNIQVSRNGVKLGNNWIARFE